MTSHPKDLSDDLIDTMAGLDKVCEHLHLPLQSGSDKVLKAMNRGYTCSQYLQKINKIREKIPRISITTDILVGFPGETDKDFKDTVMAVKEAQFDSLFGFKYSVRPGTSASELIDTVTLENKEKRLKKVLELGSEISTTKNAKLLNTAEEVLVEEKTENTCQGSTRPAQSAKGGLYAGATRTNRKITFESSVDLTGKTVRVKITGVKINSLSGKII